MDGYRADLAPGGMVANIAAQYVGKKLVPVAHPEDRDALRVETCQPYAGRFAPRGVVGNHFDRTGHDYGSSRMIVRRQDQVLCVEDLSHFLRQLQAGLYPVLEITMFLEDLWVGRASLQDDERVIHSRSTRFFSDDGFARCFVLRISRRVSRRVFRRISGRISLGSIPSGTHLRYFTSPPMIV